MFKDFKIVINSSIKYFDIACLKLLDSFYKHFPEYPKNNIYIFLGGGEPDKGYIKCMDSDVNKYVIPHNSFDYNSHISILDLELQFEYFFYLHDTCLVGPKFLECISNYNPEHLCKPVVNIASMNSGMCKRELLDKNKDHLMSAKNPDYSESGIQISKKYNVANENYLFKNNFSEVYGNKPVHLNDYDNYYGTNTNRLVEYYESIDLIKFKANYQHREEWVVQL